ncbi:hypothetical protein ACET3Z_004153 [Daucus carota]
MTAAIFSTLRRRRRHNQHRRTKRDKLTRLYDDGEEDKRLGLLLPVIALEACPEALSVVPSFKKQKTCDFQTTTNTSSANGVSELNILAVKPINRNKGGPRIALYDVCRRTQWPLPKFETAEEKSRSPIEFTDGLEKRQGFSSFVSEITLTIPDRCTVVVNGQARPDKKSSLDSGCLMMLYELEQRGFLTIEKS